MPSGDAQRRGATAQLGGAISQDRNFYFRPLLGVELVTAPQLSEYVGGVTVRFFWTKFNICVSPENTYAGSILDGTDLNVGAVKFPFL